MSNVTLNVTIKKTVLGNFFSSRFSVLVRMDRTRESTRRGRFFRWIMAEGERLVLNLDGRLLLVLVLDLDLAGRIFVVLVRRRTAREDPIAVTPPATATAPASIMASTESALLFISE